MAAAPAKATEIPMTKMTETPTQMPIEMADETGDETMEERVELIRPETWLIRSSCLLSMSLVNGRSHWGPRVAAAPVKVTELPMTNIIRTLTRMPTEMVDARAVETVLEIRPETWLGCTAPQRTR